MGGREQFPASSEDVGKKLTIDPKIEGVTPEMEELRSAHQLPDARETFANLIELLEGVDLRELEALESTIHEDENVITAEAIITAKKQAMDQQLESAMSEHSLDTIFLQFIRTAKEFDQKFANIINLVGQEPDIRPRFVNELSQLRREAEAIAAPLKDINDRLKQLKITKRQMFEMIMLAGQEAASLVKRASDLEKEIKR